MDRKSHTCRTTTFVAPTLRMVQKGKTPKKKVEGKDIQDPAKVYFDREVDVVSRHGGSFRVYEKGSGDVTVVLLHGGGLSAMSWALFATKLCARSPSCRCVAIDLRGHGSTTVIPETDLSISTLCSDVAEVVSSVVDAGTAVCLVGHSMGGAIAVHTVSKQLIHGLAGLIVVDVVEGSALEACAMMSDFIQSRPTSFQSLSDAIEWNLENGQLKNVESARVSVPPQFVQRTINSEARYFWKVDLEKTEPFWKGWFKGLSRLFLSCPVPKLLLLAGMNTLDVELTIGQMQGKFQLQALSGVGHCVHEDAPGPVADIVAKFIDRNQLGTSNAFKHPSTFKDSKKVA